MPAREARLVQLLQSAQPMRLFRHCRYLSRTTVDEILDLTNEAAPGEPAHDVGEAVRKGARPSLRDGRRLPSKEIDRLLARLSA
jgi:hypothetical protein